MIAVGYGWRRPVDPDLHGRMGCLFVPLLVHAPEGELVVAVGGAAVTSGAVIAGGVVSRTVTLKLFVAGLPWASVAAQLTVVAPIGNVVPEPGVHTTGTLPSTRSAAVGAAKVTTAPLCPAA